MILTAILSNPNIPKKTEAMPKKKSIIDKI